MINGEEHNLLIAAYAFLQSMQDRSDGHANGPFPFWHGWAIIEAFMEGSQWRVKQSSTDRKPLEQSHMHQQYDCHEDHL